jgi:hypothetical protein
MWESITRGKETKETIVMLHVDRNSEQDNRMMGNGDEDKTQKHWSIKRRGWGVDDRTKSGVDSEIVLEETLDQGL